MQSSQQFPKKVALPLVNQVGDGYMHSFPAASPFDAVLPSGAKHTTPFHGVEFQQSMVCPKNFIIFDQTDNRSQIMFHPAIAHKLTYPSFNIHAAYDNFEKKDANKEEREASSLLKEDSDDIDALLSLEEDEDEEEECDEEEVSTARTNGSYGNRSPDSCSNYGSKPRKIRSSASFQKSSSSGGSCSSERKRMKLKKMVKVLREIVPGGNRMNTVAVLDEAVRYLKSLKVEVQKIGVGNLKN